MSKCPSMIHSHGNNTVRPKSIDDYPERTVSALATKSVRIKSVPRKQPGQRKSSSEKANGMYTGHNELEEMKAK